MSFLHLIYVGHFEHDGDWVRYSNTPTAPISKPVVSQPLDLDQVRQFIGLQSGGAGADGIFPNEWGLWLEDGFLGGNRYALSQEAIVFLARLAETTGCRIVDDQGHMVISADELAPAAGSVLLKSAQDGNLEVPAL